MPINTETRARLTDYINKNKNAKPETLLAAQFIDSNFLIDSVEEHLYQGQASLADFHTYNAKILYFAIHLQVAGWYVPGVGAARITIHDIANAAILDDTNQAAYWDVVAGGVKYLPNHLDIFNIHFARYADTTYVDVIFIGYKINLQ